MTPACDACKRRKVKCDRERPCAKCLETALVCTYDSIPLRKGRKSRTARLLPTLRAVSASQPRSPAGKDTQESRSDTSTCTYATRSTNSLDACGHSPGHTGLHSSSATFTESPLFHQNTGYNPYEGATLDCHTARGRVESTILQAHVQVFLKHLFPIMPVFQPEAVLQDCSDPESLSEQRYAFLVALCAATHIQLNLDCADPTASSQYWSDPDSPTKPMTGELLIAEVMKTRQEFDILDHPDCTTLLTSFFLFAAYGNLNKPQHALFYLHQSISFAFMLGLHDENTYTGLLPSEAELRRRVYWLLFITERAYCLQLAKPILLSPSVRKPEVFSSSDPVVTYGYLKLIRLFEKLSPSLYRHNSGSSSSSYHEQLLQKQLVVDIYYDISSFEPPLDEIPETQKVDILVTRNWLQIILLGIVANSHSRSPDLETVRPDSNPCLALVTCAKSTLETISSASQSSVAAHGIGMEQKLYDVAVSTIDTLAKLSASTVDIMAASMVNPKDLIWEYIRVLSDIRGNPSYLLPKLTQHAESLLGLTSLLQPSVQYLSPFHMQESSNVGDLEQDHNLEESR